MGGAVGTLAAASDDRIKFLISLAGMVNTKAFYEREFEAFDSGVCGGTKLSGYPLFLRMIWKISCPPLPRLQMESAMVVGSRDRG